MGLVTLGAAGPKEPQPPQHEQLAMMQEMIGMMQKYLEVSHRWIDMASRPETAVYLAAEGITEIYEHQGDKSKAIPHLRKVMERHKGNRTVESAIRFKIRDIYKDSGQFEEALAELDAIVEANAK
jgi:hypothetical protein